MKNKIAFALFISIFINIISAFAQNEWITDEKMHFKIKAPTNYTTNHTQDGTDKILTLLSPDQNVMVRVRALNATSEFTPQLIQKSFEKNVINGAQRVVNENGKLNSIPALTAAYTLNANGSNAVLGIYYIVHQGYAYIVWSAVPRNLIQKRSAEADGILNTFSLLNPTKMNVGNGVLGIAAKNGGIGSKLKKTVHKQVVSSQSPPPPTPPTKPKAISNSNYLTLVSDDACVEHFYPKGFKMTSVEQGQSIWEDGSGVKMVIQTIFKTGNFRSYTSNNASSIASKGANLLYKEYNSVFGEEVFQYFYTYSTTFFAYFAIENNNYYYLVGFVGNNQLKNQLVKYSNDVMQSARKVRCKN